MFSTLSHPSVDHSNHAVPGIVATCRCSPLAVHRLVQRVSTAHQQTISHYLSLYERTRQLLYHGARSRMKLSSLHVLSNLRKVWILGYRLQQIYDNAWPLRLVTNFGLHVKYRPLKNVQSHCNQQKETWFISMCMCTIITGIITCDWLLTKRPYGYCGDVEMFILEWPEAPGSLDISFYAVCLIPRPYSNDLIAFHR